MSETGTKPTKSEFDEFLRGLGKEDPNNVGEPVFYITTDEPLNPASDYLVTVAVDGRTYGLTRPHDGSYLDPKLIYFSLTDGHQVDFVDGTRKQSDEAAARDLSDYSGQVVITLYKTDPQTPGVYPTGLVRMSERTVQLEGGD